MTLVEFFGCTLLAFGPPLIMFIFTIAHDPVRIIIMVAAAFCWFLSLLLSSMWWIMVVPLKKYLVFGLIFSVIFQEVFRYLLYRLLRKAENGLKRITSDVTSLVDNKHILAYVCGLGFGVISGIFSSVNVLADSVGPGTMGLKGGTQSFFMVSSFMSLCFTLLHTLWSIILFNAFDEKNYKHIGFVICSHLFVSGLSLFNRYDVQYITIPISYIYLIVTSILAFKVAGGTVTSIKRSLYIE